jgi:hypothetical protein
VPYKKYIHEIDTSCLTIGQKILTSLPAQNPEKRAVIEVGQGDPVSAVK